MASSNWTRRNLLKGLGAGTALLPFTPLLNTSAGAGAAEPPKRLIIWFYPNGTLPEDYFPKGDELSVTPILEPMAEHIQDCIVMNGVDLKAYNPGIKIVHISCVAPLLTGYTILDGDHENGGTSYGWAGGPSVDQVLAERIGGDTPFPTLEFHNVGMKDDLLTQYRIIYGGADQPITGMRHPADAFKRIFEGSDLGKDSAFIKNELSVMAKLQRDLDRLQAKLPTQEHEKVLAHLEGVRLIEKRLQEGDLACDPVRPTRLDGIDGFEDGSCGRHDNSPFGCLWDSYYEEVCLSHIDVMVEALACGATNIASLQNGAGGRGHKFTGWDDLGGDEHIMSHDPPPRYTEVKQWYMTKLAYLVDKLKAIPEGTGTLFDNTMILACSEHGVGWQHSPTNIPFMIVGGKWAFETGRYLQLDDASNNDLLTSICHAMGATDIEKFGDPQFCKGPLKELSG